MSDDIDEGREPPREDPGFRVYVERDGERIDVTHAVMDAYEVAVSSLDFGSGFLSTEEVGNLRTLGQAIGAERFDYQHDKCLRCGHGYDSHGGYYKIPDTACRSRDCSCESFVSPVGV